MPVGSLNLVYITVLYVLIQLSLSLPLALPLLSSRSRCTPLSPPASRLSYTTVQMPIAGEMDAAGLASMEELVTNVV